MIPSWNIPTYHFLSKLFVVKAKFVPNMVENWLFASLFNIYYFLSKESIFVEKKKNNDFWMF